MHVEEGLQAGFKEVALSLDLCSDPVVCLLCPAGPVGSSQWSQGSRIRGGRWFGFGPRSLGSLGLP